MCLYLSGHTNNWKTTEKKSAQEQCDRITVNVLKFRTLFSFCSQIKLVFRAVIHNMFIRIANREDPDQTATSEAV